MNRAFAVAVAAAACSSPAKPLDAAVPVAFQGEYVDWDSDSNIEPFCGILGAEITFAGSGSSKLTPPNGRLNLTLPVGVDEIALAPDMPRQCPGIASGDYDNPGTIVVDLTLAAGSDFVYSTRLFTTDRRTSMFSSLGLTYDPTAAQVLVNVQGQASNPKLAGFTGTTAAYSGSAWGSGATGIYVFFPNVDISAGSATLTANNFGHAQILPLTAGAFTYAAVSD
jgi:hypothetical protein